VTVLPLEYLHVPQFHLVEWYAGWRAVDLNLEYNQVLPIHHFPIEEILADAIQQYFRDVSHNLPEFRDVEICRIQLEPEFLDNQGPDNFLVSIPCGPWQLEELISETALLNPKLDLVN
jgi:hypothetical protein